jgi:putative transcriptional regulator
MKTTHHPSEETLLRHAAGTLAAGPSIVVGAHIAGCPRCRARISDYEAVGGALLEAMEPTPMAPTALSDALALIENQPVGTEAKADSARPIEIDGIRLPDTLAGCRIGRWRWMGPGMRFSRIRIPHDPGANIMLLKVGPGMGLPEHGHSGTEYTYIVSGSFSDEMGRYVPGDLAEMDAEVEHQPVVDAGQACICLAALDGRMRFNGLLGRLVQPLFGV